MWNLRPSTLPGTRQSVKTLTHVALDGTLRQPFGQGVRVIRVKQVLGWLLLLLLLPALAWGKPAPVKAKPEPVKAKPEPLKVDKALQKRCADPKRKDTRECVQLRASQKSGAANGKQARPDDKKPRADADRGHADAKRGRADDKPAEIKVKPLSAKEKKQLAALKNTCADKKKAKTAQCKKYFADEQARADAAEHARVAKLCADKKNAKTAQCKKFVTAEKKKSQTVSVCGRKYGIAKKNEKVASFAKRYHVAEGTLRGWNAIGAAAKLKGGKRYLVYKSPHDGVTLKGGVLLEGDDEHFAIQRPARGWGKPLLVDAIRIGVHATQRQNPHGTHLIVGDLSKEGGGCLPPHKSHRGGVDADVGLYMRGAHQRKWLGGATPETLDADRTWQLLRAFFSTGRLQYAFIDYSLQQPLYEAGLRAGEPEEHLKAWFQWPRPIENAHETIVRHLAGHDNHMHVRFLCDPDENCVLPDDAKARLEHARIEMLGSVAHEPNRPREALHQAQSTAVPEAMP
jgi:hypothetical protein